MRTTNQVPEPAQPSRVISLRSRWNRAFALLTVMVLLSGLAGLLGTRLLVDSFRDSAVRAELEATTTARLRAEIVACREILRIDRDCFLKMCGSFLIVALVNELRVARHRLGPDRLVLLDFLEYVLVLKVD